MRSPSVCAQCNNRMSMSLSIVLIPFQIGTRHGKRRRAQPDATREYDLRQRHARGKGQRRIQFSTAAICDEMRCRFQNRTVFAKRRDRRLSLVNKCLEPFPRTIDPQ